ncbi:sensor histidine kinase [Nocardia veterana]|uniref:sensor histidine kinase n=1 Tax=Nocardia veterana TaxID=132249 RepID=UPI0002F063D1|nr:HAMP domain-containing sensor histidine kinase [Nocardia veterana]
MPESRTGRARWWSSVRARTTAGATVVVAAALIAAGAAVLTVLRHNLIDSASLQAEATARAIATRIAAGVDYAHLNLPDADDQPVQVISRQGVVLAADDDLPRRPVLGTGRPPDDPAGQILPVPGTGLPGDDEDRDDDDDEADEPGGDDESLAVSGPSRVAGAAGRVGSDIAVRDLRLPVADRSGGHEFRVAALSVTPPDGEPVTVYSGVSLATADRAVSGVRTAMLLGLIPLLALVATVTWLVTRRALRPVEAIRAELAEIVDGDLSRRVPEPPARDEIARLAATTNTTLSALEAAAQRQRRFIADAAHELRSPIASLRTQLEVARAHPELLELDGILDDTVRLEHLAADLLLLARLDSGEQPRRDTVDVAALVRDELTRRAGDRHPITLELPEPDSDPPIMVRGSRIHLGRVLSNLVDNAQRHAAGLVRVRVTGDADRAVLEVCDDGAGVPESDRERIFRRFVRLDDARSRDDGGAGLGLAIVADVVAGHDGRIEVDTSPEGGARFTVTLPAADAPT